MSIKQINFSKSNGLVPAVIQDSKSKKILMLGFMNKVAINKTIKTSYVYFWSRSRKKLWKKGERSGNYLKVKKILIDCDNDSIVIMAKILGTAVCHLGSNSCFIKTKYEFR